MSKTFKVGDHVSWNSEAGTVSGVIIRKVTSDISYNGYVHHASKKQPQYLIKSDKTDHIAIHKGAALHLIKSRRDGKTRNARGKKMAGR
jgi:Hypervirulence associated proteins TUDOR domain